MRRDKAIYVKRATSLETQITTLRDRGVVIADEEKAKEFLLDIGYYRLGFYIHPFEKTYPLLDKRRRHDVLPLTTLEQIIAFYYYNMDLRNILNKYLARIEIAVRTVMVYELSNKYSSNPYWYVTESIVDKSFISEFQNIYRKTIQTKEPIKRHHRKYQGNFAPVWKTMEYTTFGNLEALYSSLLLNADKSLISNRFEEPAINKFKNYMSVMREVRNSCAHGNMIVGLTLTNNVEAGSKACPSIEINSQNTFKSALRIIDYMIKRVSVNRANDMWVDIYKATAELYAKAPSLQTLVEKKTGIVLPSVDSRK